MSRQFNKGEINESRKNYQNMIRANQIECDHKDGARPTLDSIDNVKEPIRDRDSYPNGFVCRQCKECFTLTSYTTKDIRDALVVFYNMCNQAKVLFNPSDADYEQIKNIMAFMDSMQETFIPYYNTHIKELANGQKKQGGDNTRTKGRLGINSGSFARN